MNNIVENSVFKFFEEISKIPRNSGKEKKMQNYLVEFAKSRNLPFYADEYNNVIIFKKTSDVEPIILQAHTDMVCVKTPKSNVDFTKDPITLVKKGNLLKAKETSLGADDGIGVALILDILDSDIPCNIEAVFTSEEETTMQGAYKLDVKRLKSKQMICLDGFDGNTILTSSAGFVDFYVSFKTEKFMIDNTTKTKTFYLCLSGLEGGHSGFDIDKNRGSSHKLLAQLLSKIKDFKLVKFFGGHNYNVIPSRSECFFTTDLPENELKNIIKYFYITNRKVYKNLKIKCSRQLNQTLVSKNSENFINFINDFNQGVQYKDEEKNIIASQNLSEVNLEKGYFKIGLRSSDKKKEEVLIKNLKSLCEKYSFIGKVLDNQPAFNTLQNSSLLKKLEQTGNNPKQTKMHIAVECGIFQERIKNLDAVIISPTITNAHSVNETLDINSTIYTSNWLKSFLKIN